MRILLVEFQLMHIMIEMAIFSDIVPTKKWKNKVLRVDEKLFTNIADQWNNQIP